jgi:hypothetical protein
MKPVLDPHRGLAPFTGTNDGSTTWQPSWTTERSNSPHHDSAITRPAWSSSNNLTLRDRLTEVEPEPAFDRHRDEVGHFTLRALVRERLDGNRVDATASAIPLAVWSDGSGRMWTTSSSSAMGACQAMLTSEIEYVPESVEASEPQRADAVEQQLFNELVGRAQAGGCN